jgi:predicted DNA-binding transcriptional regulator YafY
MSTNLHAALRYNIIDQCLRDRYKVNTWQRLAQECYNYLTVHHFVTSLPSRRTIMGDIHIMRNGLLGYEAPIGYSKEWGYHYTDPKFSIHKSSVPVSVLEDIYQLISSYKMITGYNNVLTVHRALDILEDKLNQHINKNIKPILYFEHSLNEKGQAWIEYIYQKIKERQSIAVDYLPFDQTNIVHFISPIFLKEYNNRWYVFGYSFDYDKIINLALDRIINCKSSVRNYLIPKGFDHDIYFKHIYGVTKPDNEKPMLMIFMVTPQLKNYLITKPLHPTQRVIEETEDKSIFSIEVFDNYEIRSKIMSFGEDLIIISPVEFKDKIKSSITLMARNYDIN